LSGPALSGAADLRLDVPHDAADGVMVRLATLVRDLNPGAIDRRQAA